MVRFSFRDSDRVRFRVRDRVGLGLWLELKFGVRG